MTNRKFRTTEQIELDQKLAAYMEFFDLPYFEHYFIRGWQALCRSMQQMYPECVKEHLDGEAILISWKGEVAQRTQVLGQHFGTMFRLLLHHFQLTNKGKGKELPLVKLWVAYMEIVKQIEELFEKECGRTLTEYHNERFPENALPIPVKK